MEYILTFLVLYIKYSRYFYFLWTRVSRENIPIQFITPCHFSICLMYAGGKPRLLSRASHDPKNNKRRNSLVFA